MHSGSIKKNTAYNAVKTFSSILFPLVTFPYISRVLMAENVGRINFGLSIISYFSLIATLGITTYAIRECSAVRNEQDKLNQVASQIYSINLITTGFAYILLLALLLLYRRLAGYRILILVQSLSILFATLGTDWLNSAMEDFRYITLRTVAFQFLSLLLMFVFIRQPEDYMKYIVISLISGSGANILNIWYRQRYCRVRFTAKIDWKTHMKPILLLFVMLLAQDIFSNVDSTMLGLMHGDREVGIYTAAQKINRVVSQVVSSVLWVIMPRMSLYFAERNYPEINRLLRKLLGFNLLIGLPCVTGLIVLAKDIVLVAAGQDFVAAAPVLQIRALSMLFALFGGNLLGNAVLLPSKQEKYYMVVCVITAGINILTNFLVIPRYASIGAAFTTAFCSLCILVMLLFRIDKRIRFEQIGKLLASPVIGCLAIIAICTVFTGVKTLSVRIVFSIFCSVVVYSVLQILMKNELAGELLSMIRGKIKKVTKRDYVS